MMKLPSQNAETGAGDAQSSSARPQPWDIDVRDVMEGRYYEDASVSPTAMAYMLYVPKRRCPAKKRSLVMYLHGAGQKGSHFEHILKWAPLRGQLLYMLVNDPAYRDDAIIYAPQCPPGDVWSTETWGTGVYDFASTPERTATRLAMGCLYNGILRKYPVDLRRIYLTGYSMGAMGVWDILARYPDTFAAAMPVSGATDPATAPIIKGIPIWTFHAADDAVVPPAGTRAMVKALTALGSEIHYTEYPTGGHGTIAMGTNDRRALDWMMSRVKGAGNPGRPPGPPAHLP